MIHDNHVNPPSNKKSISIFVERYAKKDGKKNAISKSKASFIPHGSLIPSNIIIDIVNMINRNILLRVEALLLLCMNILFYWTYDTYKQYTYEKNEYYLWTNIVQ